MDQFDKALKKLPPKKRRQVEQIIARLLNGDTKGLDIKKLKGAPNVFRVRVGTLRILYQIHKGELFTLSIEHRSEKTYKKYRA